MSRDAAIADWRYWTISNMGVKNHPKFFFRELKVYHVFNDVQSQNHGYYSWKLCFWDGKLFKLARQPWKNCWSSLRLQPWYRCFLWKHPGVIGIKLKDISRPSWWLDYQRRTNSIRPMKSLKTCPFWEDTHGYRTTKSVRAGPRNVYRYPALHTINPFWCPE